MNKERWVKRQSERYGLSPRLLKRVFHQELTAQKGIADPLEVPDRIEMSYKYSYGGISRFFRELRENKRIMGSHCPRCQTVYLPPRIHCSRCYVTTEWVPLGKEGTIVTCTVVHYATSQFFRETPFVCAYIKVDGADTLLLHNVVMKDVRQAKPGMRVKAVFKKERNGDMGDFYFVPVA